MKTKQMAIEARELADVSGIYTADALRSLADQVEVLTAERDALRARLIKADAALRFEKASAQAWKTGWEKADAEIDKLKKQEPVSIDRKAALELANQSGFKYIDHIAFRAATTSAPSRKSTKLIVLCDCVILQQGPHHECHKAPYENPVTAACSPGNCRKLDGDEPNCGMETG